MHLNQSDAKETNEKSNLTTALVTAQSQSINPTDNETYIYDVNGKVPINVVKVKVVESITKIDAFVFQNYTLLTSIVIPDSITTIGKVVFYNCRSLTSTVIPYSTTIIGNSVFKNCTILTSITTNFNRDS